MTRGEAVLLWIFLAIVACPPTAAIAVAETKTQHPVAEFFAAYMGLLLLSALMVRVLSEMPAGWIDNAVRTSLRVAGMAATRLLALALVLTIVGALLFVVVRLIHWFWYW